MVLAAHTARRVSSQVYWLSGRSVGCAHAETAQNGTLGMPAEYHFVPFWLVPQIGLSNVRFSQKSGKGVPFA